MRLALHFIAAPSLLWKWTKCLALKQKACCLIVLVAWIWSISAGLQLVVTFYSVCKLSTGFLYFYFFSCFRSGLDHGGGHAVCRQVIFGTRCHAGPCSLQRQVILGTQCHAVCRQVFLGTQCYAVCRQVFIGTQCHTVCRQVLVGTQCHAVCR